MAFKIGLVGCGRLAWDFHGPAIQHYAETHPNTELAACCDIDAGKAQGFSERFGFSSWETDFTRMLARHAPDAVCLVVPEHRTCEISCEVVGRGFPLLLEKPPGLTTEQIDRMIHVMESAGVHVDVAFNRRYMPLIRKLVALIAEHVSGGGIQHIQYEMVRWNRADPDFTLTAIHGIDLVGFVAKSPYRSVRCDYQPLPAFGPTVANLHLSAEFESGATAHLSFCPVAGAVVERISVHAPDHSFYVELPLWQSLDAPGRLTHVCKGKVVCSVSGTEMGGTEIDVGAVAADSVRTAAIYGFYGEDAAFFDQVRQGNRSHGGLRDARQTVALAQSLRERSPAFVSTGADRPCEAWRESI